MRKLVLMATLGIASLMAPQAKAQASVSVNIGSQPQWGPQGYNHVDYYYLPDVESYYYVPSRQFIYLSGNRWIRSSRLPSRYRSYNLYNGRKYVINSPRPYLHHNNYRTRYGGYGYNRPGRVIVRNNHSNFNRNHTVYRGGNYRGGNNRSRNVIVRGHDNNRGHNDNRGRGNNNRGHDNRGGGPGNHGGHDNHGNRGRH